MRCAFRWTMKIYRMSLCRSQFLTTILTVQTMLLARCTLTSTLYSEAATVISGWFPIYDTIHGIRGEINVVVKVDLFNDSNRFRQSSCGVKFFCTTSIPKCYRAVVIHGFVEELVVNEDPEYQWIDRIRTPRASNEARQRLISLMSGSPGKLLYC